MRISRTIRSTPEHDLQPLGSRGHRNRMLKNRNHAILAARIPGIYIVHIRLDIALKRRIVEQAFCHHYVRLLLIESKRMLDRVASRENRVLLPLAAEHMASSLLAKLMGFIN